MRILIDLQSLQTASRFRGIGRYAYQLSKALIETKGENEVFVLLNGTSEDSAKEIVRDFSRVLPRENIVKIYVPEGLAFADSDKCIIKQDAELIYEAVVEYVRPELLLLTSVFEGYRDEFVLPRLIGKGVRIGYIFYDLIPYKSPEKYLGNLSVSTWYRERFARIKKYDYAYAISDFVRDEVKTICQIKDVVSIGSGKSEFWQPVDVTSKQLKEFGLRQQDYILYYGGSDERKNIGRLIEAYSLLDTSTNAPKLVICCGKSSKKVQQDLLNYAHQLGIDAGKIKILGYLPDEDLRLLATACALYVFPSEEEGFGLPLLEAMSCGAPAICSGVTSLPEVLDYPSAYFDPLSAEDIKKTIERFLLDTTALASLKEHCLKQSKKFTWKNVANRVWEHVEIVIQDKLCCTNDVDSIVDDLCLRLTNIRHEEKQLRILSRCIEKTFYSENKLSNQKKATHYKVFPKICKNFTAVVDGPFETSYSLAEVNRCFAEALYLDGHDVSLTESAHCKVPSSDTLKKLGINENLAVNLDKKPDVYFRNTYPPCVEKMEGSVRAYHCYGWEETRFVPSFVEGFNNGLDIVFTLSNYVTKVLQDSGVTVPIVTVGSGVDNWEKAKCEPYDLETKRFVFVHVSSCFPRKAPEVILEAYGKAFTKDDDVTLIIKTFSNPHNSIKEVLASLEKENDSFPHVIIIEDDLSVGQLKSLMMKANIAVLPSRGEGFGLPHAQAFLSGIPLITVKWSGQCDFTSESNTFFVDYDITQAKTHFQLKDSLWAEPNVEHLAMLMKKASLMPKDLLRSMADKGAEIIRSNYSWEKVVERVSNSINKIAGIAAPQDLNVAWISPWNIKCGIAEFSKYEIDHLATPVTILAPRDLPLVNDGDNVVRCWSRRESVSDLKDQIDNGKYNVVVLQFHESFFTEDGVDDLLMHLHKNGIVSLVIFHKTKSSSAFNMSKAKCFALADRLLVHSVEGVNDLKAIGCTENVTLRPLGINAPYKALEDFSIPDNLPMTIATFGFFLPHKGLREIIEVMRILKSRGDRWNKLKLVMYNSAYPSPISYEEIEYIQRLVEKYHLEESVEIHTEFLDIVDAIHKLREAALIVYPYQDTSEEASGAVRIGLASGRPVMVSDSHIFDDLSTEVFRLSGCDPVSIADGIDFYFNQPNAPIFKQITNNAYQWVTEHSFERVAEHLEKLMFALNQQNWLKEHGVQTEMKLSE